jgi:hypothetical protein
MKGWDRRSGSYARAPSRGSYDPPQVERPGLLLEDAHHGGYAQSMAGAGGLRQRGDCQDHGGGQLPVPARPEG